MVEKKKCPEDGECRFQEGMKDKKSTYKQIKQSKKKVTKVLMLPKRKCPEDGECRFQEVMKDKKVQKK